MMKYLFILLTLLTYKGFAQTLTNSSIVVVEPGTLLCVSGNVVNNSSASFFIKGQLNISGNITNHDANFGFSASTGKLFLNGNAQTIGGTFSSHFPVLELSGGIKTLEQGISVGHNIAGPGARLLLNSGILKLNSQLLTIRAATPLALQRTTGFIQSETNSSTALGKIQWDISNAPVNTTFTFPFGNILSNSYLPVSLKLKQTAPANAFLIAATYSTDASLTPNNRPLPNLVADFNDNFGQEMAAKALDRFWVIESQNMDASATVDVAATYRDTEWDATANSTNVINEAGLKPIFWNGGGWDIGGGATDAVGNIVSWSDLLPSKGNLSAYDNSISGPLPLNLIAFNVQCVGNGIRLQWITDNEINTKQFTVELSSDGITWIPNAIIPAKGNSRQEIYTTSIASVNAPLYRLKMEDRDGSFTYSNVKRLNCDIGNKITVGPNPTTGIVNVSLFMLQKHEITLTILDIKGSLVYSSNFKATEGLNAKVLDLSNKANGVYFIKLTSVNGLNETHRVIKK